MSQKEYFFTSESVSEGHPDKMADQISDAILDAILHKDKHAHVACETMVKTGLIFIAGEISTTASVDIERIARQAVKDIGYTEREYGFDSDTCAVILSIGKQSPDIAQGVNKPDTAQGAGDQGLMFGYASKETKAFMPAPIFYAHLLMKRQAELRKTCQLTWLRPDAKTQITFHYKDNKPIAINNIVLSTQHSPEITQAQIKEAVIEEIIKKTIPHDLLKSTTYFINPTGRFVIGGPKGDCGLTGRKIIVDTYGGMARHGGGCFSGKDPSKVDRSGAYMARYIAKNLVAADLCDRCEIQLSYAIGLANPTAIHIETFGTEKRPLSDLLKLIEQHFPMTPHGIITTLDLLRPIYQKTASYGHFGRDDIDLPWEHLDKVTTLNLLNPSQR